MTDLALFRQFYADLVTAQARVRDARVRAAFAAVPREAFLGGGPWAVRTPDGYVETPSDDPRFVYHDILVALDADRGINNGQPSLHARCLDLVAPQAGEQVLHVGCGSGYYSAILAELVGSEGRVEGFEVDAGLAALADENLAPWANVHVQCRSAATPPLPPCDVVYVNAGVAVLPPAWPQALRDGGRLILPLTPGDDRGGMLLVKRTGERFAARFISPAWFIPAVGLQPDDAVDRLRAAFAGGDWHKVRSLWLDPEVPDDSCWLSGAGWWLSTRELAA